MFVFSLVKKGHERPKYGNLHSDQTLNLVDIFKILKWKKEFKFSFT